MLCIFIAFLAKLGLSNSVVSESSHFFNGYSIDARRWQVSSQILDCFSNRGTWRKSKFPLHVQPKKASLCRSPYNVDKCSNSTGRKYDYDTGFKCGKVKNYFSVERMCEVMNGKGIGFIGDSLQEEMSLSFMNAMFEGGGTACEELCQQPCIVNFDCSSLSQRHGRNLRSKPINGSFSLLRVRNDALLIDNRTANKQFLSGPAYGKLQPWVHFVRKNNISIVVLNRGAHYTNDSTFVHEVNRTLHFMSVRLPKVSVVYRSTSVGHVNSSDQFDAPPLTVPQVLLEKDGYNPRYNWVNFHRQNLLVKDLIRMHYPNMLYLDVYDATSLRSDAHRDGIHYCIPGPIDSWVDLLFQAVDLFAPPSNISNWRREYTVTHVRR